MANSEYNHDEMVVLYDPSAVHQCNLPDIKVLNYRLTVQPRTIMECDECAQRWWASIDFGNYESNRWRKLCWFHFVLRSKIA